MGIKIQDLPATVTPSRAHFVPAMKDDVTVRLTVGQILDLVINAAPGALDTLKELADALGDDPNFATTVTNALALKANTADVTAALALKANADLAPVGLINGLNIANNAADAVNDIDIASGEAASDGATRYSMKLASSLTKRMDAAWAVGSGNGGWLDGASMPNGTGHVFLMQRSDTGVVDVGASASLSPTLPTNYDRKRRIGSILRVSAAIRAFIQDGDFFQFKTPTVDASAISTTATLRAISIPAGIRAMARIGVQVAGTGGQPTMHHWDPLVGASLPSARTGVTQAFVDSSVSQGVSVVLDVMSNTSSQIYNALASGTATSYVLHTLGYFDTRGRQ